MLKRTRKNKSSLFSRNAFCPTGPGGGQDNSCTSKGVSQSDLEEMVSTYVQNPDSLSSLASDALAREVVKSKTSASSLIRVSSKYGDHKVGEVIHFQDPISFTRATDTILEGRSAGHIAFKSSDRSLYMIEKPMRGLDVDYSKVKAMFNTPAEQETITSGSYRVKEIKNVVEPGTYEPYGYKTPMYVLEEVHGTHNSLTNNPFVSESQRRACYAVDDPSWDCKEWSSVTPKNIPNKVKKRTRKGKQSVGNKSLTKKSIPLKGLALHAMMQNEVHKKIGKIVETLLSVSGSPTKNAFCATGQGGGQDNSCSSHQHAIDPTDKAAKGAASFVVRWSWGGKAGGVKSLPTLAVEAVLKDSRPKQPITLYRFERVDHDPAKSQMGQKVPLQAWSKDKQATEGIAEMMNEGGDDGHYRVLTRTFQPHEIYADFGNLHPKVRSEIDKKGGDSSMSEVLVYHHPQTKNIDTSLHSKMLSNHSTMDWETRSKILSEKKVENSLFGRMLGRATVAAATVASGGDNCGIGKGGFQPGNTCASKDHKGGGGSEPSGKETSEKEEKGEDPKIHTPEFKAWFGESKVVDKNGDPKENASIDGIRDKSGKPTVVYHGTPGGVFHEFKKDHIANPDQLHFGPGFYFTEDVKAAEEFARGGHSTQATGTNPTVMKYYLKSEKPFDIDTHEIDPSKLHPSEAKNVRASLVQKAYLDGGRDDAMDMGRRFDRGEIKMKYKELADAAGVGGLGVSKSKIQEHLQSLGYDSLTTKAPDVGEKGKNRYWIVFEPHQVKSTSNKGTFNPKDPNVLNQDWVGNIFCATGVGGGVDASCSKGANVDTAEMVKDLVDTSIDISKAVIGKSQKVARAIISSHVMQQLGKSGEWLKNQTKKVYDKLTARYGKIGATAIFASGQTISWGVFLGSTPIVGFPVWVPSAVAMAPAVAIAEVVKATRGHPHTHNMDFDLTHLGQQLIQEIEGIWKTRPEEYANPTEDAQ